MPNIPSRTNPPQTNICPKPDDASQGRSNKNAVSRHCIRRIAWLLLLAYVVALISWDTAGLGILRSPEGTSEWLQLATDPVRLLRHLGLLATYQVLRYLLLGLFVAFTLVGTDAPATRPNDRKTKKNGQDSERQRRMSSQGRSLATCLICAALCFLLVSTQLHALGGWLLPLTALMISLVGAWIGRGCLRGLRAFAWMPVKLAGATTILGLFALGAIYLLTSAGPLPFEAAQVTPTQKRQLINHIQDSEKLANGYQRLVLTEDDGNRLAAMFFEHAPFDGKARCELDDGCVTIEMSLPVQLPVLEERHLNIRGAYRADIDDGRLRFEPQTMTVGPLPIPRFILKSLAQTTIRSAMRHPRAQEIMESIDSVAIEDNQIRAVFRSGELRGELVSAARALLGQRDAVVEATRVYFRHLIASPATQRHGDDAFKAHMQTAFELAKQRTASGHDPIEENRAAILALGILFGHYRLEHMVGNVSRGSEDEPQRRNIPSVTLRERKDWARHFFVSAGLTLVSNQMLGNAAGLLKEEIDAGEGGSGFSFADLLADRAGVEFATAATRDARSARRVQEAVADGFSLDEVFPSAEGLPEGIAEDELQNTYGGVGGPRYQEIADDLEQRLKSCDLLQTP